VSREDYQKVWAAITMVRSIGKIPVSFNLLDVSGEWTIDDGTTSILIFFVTNGLMPDLVLTPSIFRCTDFNLMMFLHV
jgi:hypothetical protein